MLNNFLALSLAVDRYPSNNYNDLSIPINDLRYWLIKFGEFYKYKEEITNKDIDKYLAEDSECPSITDLIKSLELENKGFKMNFDDISEFDAVRFFKIKM